jgi:PadR family transcriptional regulator, regulatory protein PadR
MTLQTRVLLAALLQAPGGELHGYQLLKGTGLSSGTLYPLLVRLERAGWVTSRWEERSEPGGRPRRRFYRLSPDAAEPARQVLARNPAPAWLRPSPEAT